MKPPHSSLPIQIEFCGDPKTGFREGPYREFAKSGVVTAEGSYRRNKIDGEYRVFDDAGRLTQVIRFSNGEVTDSRLTRIGLENSFRKLNERLRKEGRKTRWAVIDEGSVECIVTTGTSFGQPAPDEVTARSFLIKDERFCKMMEINSNLQTIIARYVDENGKEVLVVPLRRADCTN